MEGLRGEVRPSRLGGDSFQRAVHLRLIFVRDGIARVEFSQTIERDDACLKQASHPRDVFGTTGPQLVVGNVMCIEKVTAQARSEIEDSRTLLSAWWRAAEEAGRDVINEE